MIGVRVVGGLRELEEMERTKGGTPQCVLLMAALKVRNKKERSFSNG
jgi:hypothetical protein